MESVPNLPAQELNLVDVREPDEWSAGHAPQAKHIPLGELPSRIDELTELPDDGPVYVVCRTGGRSAQATAWLNANGWDAMNVAGGMKSWATEGRPMLTSRTDTGPEVL